jgi:glutathione peroxidase
LIACSRHANHAGARDNRRGGRRKPPGLGERRACEQKGQGMTTIADFTVTTIDGQELALKDKLGKVLLVVNTASRCGFTPQYAGLEALYQRFKDRGFEVLAFPCNQFGGQEPGSAEEIAAFCKANYGVTFPLMAKIDVNGEKAAPLFDWLKSQAKGVMGTSAIKWNFTKFLIDREGKVVRRYAPTDKPEAIARDIEQLL